MPPVWYARSATWGVASRNTLYSHHRARSWRERRGETRSSVVFEHSAVTGERVWSVLIAFHRPGAAVGSHSRRCGDEKRPRQSSLMILLISRSNGGSAPRDRREGSVGPSEGRATVTRSSVVFGLELQAEID